MDATLDLPAILARHKQWLADSPDGKRADLSGADLSGADLSGANLSQITLCGATIDGAVVRDDDIGGPGHILCALTDDEWAMIQAGRAATEPQPAAAADESRDAAQP